MNAHEVVRVGLIGGGAIADAHLRGYERLDRIAVTAVSEVNPSTLTRRVETLGVAGYLDYNEMLASADIDAVDVCLPHHLHADAVIAALNAGKHVLCEKPLATSSSDLDRIEHAARRSDVIVMSAHNQIYRPVVQLARRMRENGELGHVSLARVTCRVPLDTSLGLGWRGALSHGGGALMDSGFHAAYLLPHLLGAEPVEVAAMEGRFAFVDAEAEDTAVVLIRFSTGAIGIIDVSWALGQVGEQQTIELSGSGGALAGDDVGAKIELTSHQGESYRFPTVDTYEAEISEFARCILEGLEPEEGIAAARRALSIVAAARQSQSTGAFSSTNATKAPVVA